VPGIERSVDESAPEGGPAVVAEALIGPLGNLDYEEIKRERLEINEVFSIRLPSLSGDAWGTTPWSETSPGRCGRLRVPQRGRRRKLDDEEEAEAARGT
jgi:hypothetical protein